MQTNLLWTGREYHSLENCLVTVTDRGAEVSSTIVGAYEGKIYKVDYLIRTNASWQTLYVELHSRHSNHEEDLVLYGDGKGNWTLNGQPAPQFKQCVDVDLPLSPFTNTLPIRRLKLKDDETQQIAVIYLDLLAQETRPVHQKYTRLSASRYHYENVPNDFEATIEVDEQGLVVDYPQLFVRTAGMPGHYH